MTTLREEIHTYFEKWNYSHPDVGTEEMIKLFEKLIDEKIQKTEMFTRSSPDNPNHLYLQGRIFGRKEALEELKEELKK